LSPSSGTRSSAAAAILEGERVLVSVEERFEKLKPVTA